MSSLFKDMLVIIEDLKFEHDSQFRKILDVLPTEHHNLIYAANYLTDEKSVRLRKRILDIGNEAIRDFSDEFEKYTVTFVFKN
jgi:hypothetical protein